MNVLILTPDAVGSTLLQRLLTIYMQFHQYNQPVINIHELTNGLDKFYSPDFNQELITQKGKWGYYQSLQEIVDILESVDHYKTARLAQYHIKQREDTLAEQLPFYRYLNENFYIIACQRENLFEHAISHALNNITKKLNVYSPLEKINSFYGLYRRGAIVEPEQIHHSLNRYKDYLAWAEQHFSVGSHFVYEKHLPDIEKYILNLPVFSEQKQRITWKQNFNIEFDEWNRYHYYASDIGSLALSSSDSLLQLENKSVPGNNSTSALSVLQNSLPLAHKNFLKQHGLQYHKVNKSIIEMQQLGIISSTVPIKKQTLIEKLYMIRNIEQCVEVFNIWIEENPGISNPIDLSELKQQADIEYKELWDSSNLLTSAEHIQLPT